MKKLIIFLMVAFCFLMAETITTKDWANVRNSSDYKTSKVVDKIPAGNYDVISTYGDWTKIEVISGSKYAGSIGWIYTPCIDGTKIIRGCVIRKTSGKDGEKIGSIKEGAEIKIIDCKITWYEISYGEKSGFISAINVK